MELADLVAFQAKFDAKHLAAGWSARVTEDDLLPLIRSALGLAGEAGEVANLVKKADRGDLELGQAVEGLKSELADVLAYLLKLAHIAEIDLEECYLMKMGENAEKFQPREGAEPSKALEGVDMGLPSEVARLKYLSAAEIESEVRLLSERMQVSADGMASVANLFTRAGVANRSDVVVQVAGSLLAAALADVDPSSPDRGLQVDALSGAANSFGYERRELLRLSSYGEGLLENLRLGVEGSS